MTREEEIKQAATQIAKKWYCGPEDEFRYEVEKLEEMGQWVDEHPKNPWRDAKKELPPEYESAEVGAGLSIDCLVIAKEGESYWIVQAWYDYNSKCWYEKWDFNQTHIEGRTITHWMPIPELPKGGE